MLILKAIDFMQALDRHAELAFEPIARHLRGEGERDGPLLQCISKVWMSYRPKCQKVVALLYRMVCSSLSGHNVHWELLCAPDAEYCHLVCRIMMCTTLHDVV